MTSPRRTCPLLWPRSGRTYGDYGVDNRKPEGETLAVLIGAVIGGALTAIAVSAAVGVAVGTFIVEEPTPCHDCEACHP